MFNQQLCYMFLLNNKIINNYMKKIVLSYGEKDLSSIGKQGVEKRCYVLFLKTICSKFDIAYNK